MEQREPDVEKGLEYWNHGPPTVDFVLGGYGLGTLPRIDALGSRTFLLSLLPRISTVPPPTADFDKWSAERASKEASATRQTKALDCGAGVGRVTRDALLPLFDQVDLVEPIEKFLLQASKSSSKWKHLGPTKTVQFRLSTLQAFDPCRPSSTSRLVATTLSPQASRDAKRLEEEGGEASDAVKYDVVWAQWCLQHLSDRDLEAFLRRSKKALVEDGVIVVKENVCRDGEDGEEVIVWDDEDHSITRSDSAWERVFKAAGLEIVKKETAQGFPPELYPVKAWALR